MEFGSLHPAQIAYHVPDPEQAARRFAHDFGWGPFFYLEHIELAACRYRGAPAPFDHSSAYGQAGEIMVELITQHDDTPSVLRERFARDTVGIHHLAYFVPSLAKALREAGTGGIEVALDARTVTGTRFAMLDMWRELGHLVELYEPAGDLLKFYGYVKRAAAGWDGGEPFRRLSPRPAPHP